MSERNGELLAWVCVFGAIALVVGLAVTIACPPGIGFVGR